MAEPERFGIFIDHMVPAISPAEEELHKGTREWTTINEVKLYERKGIGHQVSSEVGYATPGAFAVHFDGHVSQLGTFGTLAIRVQPADAEIWIDGERWSGSDGSVALRVEVAEGRLQPGVMARDVFHHLVRVMIGVVPIPGAGDRRTRGRRHVQRRAADDHRPGDVHRRVTAIVNPDAKRLAAPPRARKKLEPVYSDEDATYAARHTIDLSTLEPIIVIPPSPANTRDQGLPRPAGRWAIRVLCLGPDEDPRAAANVLRGRKVASTFALNVVPTSQEIMVAAAKEGLIEVFAEAVSSRRPRATIASAGSRPWRRSARGLDRHAQRARPHGQP
jgi:3-isopropylmalate/(R)-2-methylmalate dehydratase large subunit